MDRCAAVAGSKKIQEKRSLIIDLNSKKIAVGFTYSASIRQQLAGGSIKAQPGINIHLSYSF